MRRASRGAPTRRACWRESAQLAARATRRSTTSARDAALASLSCARHAPQHRNRRQFHERAAPSIGGSRAGRARRRLCARREAAGRGGSAAATGLGISARGRPNGRGATARRGRARTSGASSCRAPPRASTRPRARAPPLEPPALDTGAADGDEREFAQLARSVERLGESRLEGLAKKDQRARLRGQLGLKPEKRQKMPYKLLVARRTKERAQDAAAAELARQAGMAPRRAPGQGGGGGGGGGRGGGAGSRGGWLAAEKTPSLGGALRGGVLHVTSSTIKSVNYSTKQRGGGGKGGKGGRGRGGGGGRGRGRKRRRDYVDFTRSLLAAGTRARGPGPRPSAAAARTRRASATGFASRRPASRRALAAAALHTPLREIRRRVPDSSVSAAAAAARLRARLRSHQTRWQRRARDQRRVGDREQRGELKRRVILVGCQGAQGVDCLPQRQRADGSTGGGIGLAKNASAGRM